MLLGPLCEGLGLGPWRAASLATAITLAGAAHLAYLGYVRPAIELSWSGAPGELGQGTLVGAGLLAGTVVALRLPHREPRVCGLQDGPLPATY